jgi:hypothetical protein
MIHESVPSGLDGPALPSVDTSGQNVTVTMFVPTYPPTAASSMVLHCVGSGDGTVPGGKENW